MNPTNHSIFESTPMSPTFKTRTAVALIALACAASAAPAAADDSLPQLAVSAVGAAIAAQGNAALVQIRAELRERLLETLAPYLPEPREATADTEPAAADSTASPSL
jgi:hypothetical protein